jgi:hypothetical protein
MSKFRTSQPSAFTLTTLLALAHQLISFALDPIQIQLLTTTAGNQTRLALRGKPRP